MQPKHNFNDTKQTETIPLKTDKSFPYNYMYTNKKYNIKQKISSNYSQLPKEYEQLSQAQAQSPQSLEYTQAPSSHSPALSQEHSTCVSVKLSCDFFSLSIFSTNKSLDPLLKTLTQDSLQTTHSRHKLSMYPYTCKYLLNHMNKNYQIVVSYSNTNYLPILLKVHDPDKSIIKFLQPYLNNLDYYHINAVELTFDFMHFDNDVLFNFLKSSTFLRWQSKEFDLPSVDTAYFDNPRMTRKKALRIYKKVVDDNEAIRLEIVLKRGLLNRKKIKYIEDIDKLTTNLASKYIAFKEFNFSKYRKRLTKLDYEKETIDNEIDTIENIQKKNGIRNANKRALNISKNYPNDSYLKKHPFNDSFNALVSDNSFINGNIVLLKQ
jgi:hypothetical protein